jgi:hypothetical protein
MKVETPADQLLVFVNRVFCNHAVVVAELAIQVHILNLSVSRSRVLSDLRFCVLDRCVLDGDALPWNRLTQNERIGVIRVALRP